MPTLGGQYDSLFGGAARLGVVCAGLGVPWQHVAPFVGAFSEQLSRYFEISIDPQRNSLGLMTKGEGQAFVFRVTRFMEEAGIAQRALKRFLVRAKVFEYKNVFFKIEANGRGLKECTTYFRRRPSLKVAMACLSDAGVDQAGVGLMEAVADVLQKRSAHFIGTAATLSGSLTEKVYFSQPDQPESWDRIRLAVALCGLSDGDWATVAAQHDGLKSKTSFVSLAYTDGVTHAGLKLDVHGVSPSTVGALLATPGDLERASLARLSSGMGDFSYVGIRLRPEIPLTLKTYSLG